MVAYVHIGALSRAGAVVYGNVSGSNEMQRMRAETFDPLI